jgi:tyrosine-protein phosphatase YwqE
VEEKSVSDRVQVFIQSETRAELSESTVGGGGDQSKKKARQTVAQQVLLFHFADAHHMIKSTFGAVEAYILKLLTGLYE